MEETYEDIVLKWYNKVRPMFINVLKNRFANLSYDDIEDLYQQAFLAVYDNLQAGRVREDTSWSSYIIQIGVNLATKDLRHSGITDSIYVSYEDNEDGHQPISREIEQLLAQWDNNEELLYKDINALSLLGDELNHTPEPCNSIIRLFYYDDMSMEEIAVAVNFKNATTAKSKKSQCMKTLIERVKRSFKVAELI